MTLRVQRPPLFTPGAHWSYKWQTAQMLLFLLENDRYYSSAPKSVCQQCHNSQHSSSKPCAPCMAGMNRWQTKCWLQTLIKQLISLLVNCWDFLNCDHSAPKASWSHLNLRLRQVFTFLFYVLLPLFCEELIYWKSWLE